MALGFMLLVLVALAVLVSGFKLARDWSGPKRLAAILVSLVSACLFFTFGYDTPALVRLLPAHALPIAGEWQVVFVAWGAGVLLREVTLPLWRRSLLSLALMAVTLLPTWKLVAGQVPPSSELWEGEVCRQTNPSTCGAAAAVTLLHHHGYKSSEAEMIQRCLTRADGTYLGGLYHGVAEKLSGEALQVQVANLTLEDLRAEHVRPAILLVQLTRTVAEREPRYTEQWGWRVGMSHAIVLYGFNDQGNPIIGDPSVGKEVWHLQGLQELWTGKALWLEKK